MQRSTSQSTIIIRTWLRYPSKHLDIIILWYSRIFRGSTIWPPPMMWETGVSRHRVRWSNCGLPETPRISQYDYIQGFLRVPQSCPYYNGTLRGTSLHLEVVNCCELPKNYPFIACGEQISKLFFSSKKHFYKRYTNVYCRRSAILFHTEEWIFYLFDEIYFVTQCLHITHI